MAEPQETPGVQNKWLLLIAAVIALVVVAVYNFHVASVRRQARGDEIRLLKTKADLEPGDRIERQDLAVETVRTENADAFGNVLKEDDLEFALRSNVNQAVPADRWLSWEQLLAGGAPRPSERIDPDKVSCVVEIDSSPGDLLAVGDRVNVLGVFSVDRRPPRTYRVIESVPVLSIDGRTARGMRRTRYDQVQVIVDRDVSLRLKNILTHKRGEVWLEVLNPEAGVPERAGMINPELEPLARSAAPGERGRIGTTDGL
jgi:Flp pilus assembly protein CpaB